MFWPARSKDFEKLILSVKSTYFYLKGIDVSCLVNFQHKNSILYFLYKAILGPLKSCFDQLDQEFLKNWSYLSNPCIFISREMLFREKTMFKMYFLYKPILGPLKSCFNQLDQEFFKNWSYLSNPRIFISREMLFREKTMFKMFFLYEPILTLSKSCFDKLDQEFSRCWSILAKNRIISLNKSVVLWSI